MRAIVEWAPRECNREADMLANGDTSLFDPERRIPVAVGTLVWNVLPEALKAEREAEETYRRLKETHGLPNRSAKQRNGQWSIGLSLRTLVVALRGDRPSMHLLRSLTVTFGLHRPDRSASSTFSLSLSLRLFPVSFTLCVSGVCLYSFVYSLVYWIWSYYGHYLLLG